MITDITWLYIMQVLEEFHNIFGPELRTVTGDPKRIDEVLHRVESLVLPIEGVDFDPFSICKMSSWKMIMQDFNTTVQVSLVSCIYCTNHICIWVCMFMCMCVFLSFHTVLSY